MPTDLPSPDLLPSSYPGAFDLIPVPQDQPHPEEPVLSTQERSAPDTDQPYPGTTRPVDSRSVPDLGTVFVEASEDPPDTPHALAALALGDSPDQPYPETPAPLHTRTDPAPLPAPGNHGHGGASGPPRRGHRGEIPEPHDPTGPVEPDRPPLQESTIATPAEKQSDLEPPSSSMTPGGVVGQQYGGREAKDMPEQPGDQSQGRVEEQAAEETVAKEELRELPRAGASAVTIIEVVGRNKFLLEERPDQPGNLAHAGKLQLFGGHIDEGEDAGAAIVRELSEELDLRLRSVPPLIKRGDTLSQDKTGQQVVRNVNLYRVVLGETRMRALRMQVPGNIAMIDRTVEAIEAIRHRLTPYAYEALLLSLELPERAREWVNATPDVPATFGEGAVRIYEDTSAGAGRTEINLSDGRTVVVPWHRENGLDYKYESVEVMHNGTLLYTIGLREIARFGKLSPDTMYRLRLPAGLVEDHMVPRGLHLHLIDRLLDIPVVTDHRGRYARADFEDSGYKVVNVIAGVIEQLQTEVLGTDLNERASGRWPRRRRQ